MQIKTHLNFNKFNQELSIAELHNFDFPLRILRSGFVLSGAHQAAKLTLLRTSRACPSSRSKVTTHTHSSQSEKRAHGQRLFPQSAASAWRGKLEPSNGFITTSSELHHCHTGPPSQLTGRTSNECTGESEASGAPCWRGRDTMNKNIRNTFT